MRQQSSRVRRTRLVTLCVGVLLVFLSSLGFVHSEKVNLRRAKKAAQKAKKATSFTHNLGEPAPMYYLRQHLANQQTAALTTGASYYPPAAYMGAGYGVNMVQPAMHTYAGAGAGATYMHPAISMVHPMTPALYASSPLGANPGLLGLPHQPVVLGSTQIGAPTVTMPTAVTSDGGKKTIIVNT